MAILELTPEEWRECHAAYVQEFQNSPRGPSDELQLRIRLKRLGYVGRRLDDEIRHVKET